MKRNNVLTNGLDRFSIHRSDKTWILDKFYDERSQIIPVHDLTVLCENAQDPKAVYLTHKNLPESFCLADSVMFLGVYDQTPCFAAGINTAKLASNLSHHTNAIFKDLKSVVSLLDCRDSELLTLACFMNFWHSRNKYCGKCGHKTKNSEAGHVRICQNIACKENYFPNMDPAVIVLVSSGERCLLGARRGGGKGCIPRLLDLSNLANRLKMR